MRGSVVKNVLAAFGVFFIAIMALTFVISLMSGGGIAAGDKVAVVEIEGLITDPSAVSMRIKDIEERDDVKAVVLRINSPGGAVGPSQEIHGEIMRLKKTKTVVASMGAVAASGGYYAAAAAHRIVANPGTITGSIGVIVEFVNAEGLMDKVGLKGYVVKSGKFKDTGSPFRAMDEEEAGVLKSVVDDVNAQFIKAVAEGRNMKVEDVAEIADGRIFTGAQAREKGLVDELGGLTDAINLGAELAGIKGKPYVIYPEKGFVPWKDVLGGALSENLSGLLNGFRVMYLLRTPTS
jgi:protease-4